MRRREPHLPKRHRAEGRRATHRDVSARSDLSRPRFTMAGFQHFSPKGNVSGLVLREILTTLSILWSCAMMSKSVSPCLTFVKQVAHTLLSEPDVTLSRHRALPPIIRPLRYWKSHTKLCITAWPSLIGARTALPRLRRAAASPSPEKLILHA